MHNTLFEHKWPFLGQNCHISWAWEETSLTHSCNTNTHFTVDWWDTTVDCKLLWSPEGGWVSPGSRSQSWPTETGEGNWVQYWNLYFECHKIELNCQSYLESIFTLSDCSATTYSEPGWKHASSGWCWTCACRECPAGNLLHVRWWNTHLSQTDSNIGTTISNTFLDVEPFSYDDTSNNTVNVMQQIWELSGWSHYRHEALS